MEKKKSKVKRFSDARVKLYRTEASEELYPLPPTDRPSAPARPSEDPVAEFTGYLSPDEDERDMTDK